VFLHEQGVHVIRVWCRLLNSIYIFTFRTVGGSTVLLNCFNPRLWRHTLRHCRAPGNDVRTFLIPGNEKTGPGMQTLHPMFFTMLWHWVIIGISTQTVYTSWHFLTLILAIASERETVTICSHVNSCQNIKVTLQWQQTVWRSIWNSRRGFKLASFLLQQPMYRTKHCKQFMAQDTSIKLSIVSHMY